MRPFIAERATQRFGGEAISGPKSISGQLRRMGYKVLPSTTGSYKEDRYAGGFIVQTYGSSRGTSIDAIQLEFGAKLRQWSVLDRTAADLVHAITVFAREYLPLTKFSPVVGMVTER